MSATYTDRLVIRLAPQVSEKVRARARSKGRTVAELLRGAIERELQEAA